MNHELLDGHNVFAWDMDETLINGPNSSFFRDCIAANPHKQHFIVTFRTPRSWAVDALRELEEVGFDTKLIAGVSSVPDHLYEAWALRKHQYHEEYVAQFLRWKGREASRLGCTVLVDDMLEAVRNGCSEHGVTLIDSYHQAFGYPDFVPEPKVA